MWKKGFFANIFYDILIITSIQPVRDDVIDALLKEKNIDNYIFTKLIELKII